MTLVARTAQRKPRPRAAVLPAPYGALLQHAPDHVLVLDRDGIVEYINRTDPPFAPAQVLGTHAAHYMGADADKIRQAIPRIVATGAEEKHEFPALHPDGSERWYCARMKRYADDASDPKVLLFVSDITERQHAERALRQTVRELEESRRQVLQAQKMESIGRLAGGVAHDFNNLLTAIISFSRFVMDDLAPGDPRRGDLAEVLKAADSAAKLTSQLLAFSRKRPVEPALLDLNPSVARLSKVLRRTLEESIDLRIEEHPEPVSVMFDPGQLDQLVMNLAINARDAMPDGGTLAFRIARRSVASHPELADGEYATFSVSDTGTGMTEEVMSQIFEPFFTTKGERGTGLGLATCYGIVKQARGHIDVESKLQHGSQFTVLLPLAISATGQPAANVQSQPSPSRLNGLALVVEDQSAIRTTMTRSLEGIGFNVIEARTGEEALAMVQDLAARVDLLVTDVVLPGLNGIKLADTLRAHQPGLRVLVCSGYMGHEQDTGITLDERTSFLAKPFTGPQLVQKACGLFG
jgi:two-component system cell cycle sensor histidine kinase/response regulator CckA